MANKTVLISGASSGIGKATARAFAQKQYRVMMCGRRIERLEILADELCEEFTTEVLPYQLDVRDPGAVRRMINEIPDEWRRIDVLVNNAGLALGVEPFHKGLTEDWDRMIDTNVKGLLYLSREVASLMIPHAQGQIINIGSIAGKETYMNGNVYCATKYAVDALTKAMRMELLTYGIKVSQVAPGAAETEFSEVRYKGNKESAQKVYQGYQPLKAEDVARAIVFVAEQPPHVCINDMLIMPTAQANTVHWNKQNT